MNLLTRSQAFEQSEVAHIMLFTKENSRRERKVDFSITPFYFTLSPQDLENSERKKSVFSDLAGRREAPHDGYIIEPISHLHNLAESVGKKFNQDTFEEIVSMLYS